MKKLFWSAAAMGIAMMGWALSAGETTATSIPQTVGVEPGESKGALSSLPSSALPASPAARQQLITDGREFKALSQAVDSDLPTAQWSGTVVDGDGQPVADAQVWLVPNGRTLKRLGYSPGELYVASDANGARRLENVPLAELPSTWTDTAGHFALSSHHEAELGDVGDYYRGRPETTVAIEAEGFATTVFVSAEPADGLVALGTISLNSETTLSGQVMDPSGQPLAGATVALTWSAQRGGENRKDDELVVLLPELHQTLTDASGTFTLRGLQADFHSLTAHMQGRIPEVVDWFQGLGKPIVLHPGRRLSGQVVNTAGQPVEGAAVFATDDALTYTFSHGSGKQDFKVGDDTMPIELSVRSRHETLVDYTDTRGRFILDGLVDAPHTVYAEATSFEAVRLSDVAVGQQELTLRLAPEATLAVHVLDGTTCREVHGVKIFANRLTGTGYVYWREVESLGRGQFLVHGVGHYGTSLVVVAKGYSLQYVKAPGSPNGAQSTFTVHIERPRTLHGQVFSLDGSPRAGVRILASRDASHIDRPMVWTDEDGRYELTLSGPYKYTLSALLRSPAIEENRVDLALHRAHEPLAQARFSKSLTISVPTTEPLELDLVVGDVSQ